MPSLNLTPAPTLPDINSPATFNDRALALYAWLTGTLISELETADAADFFDILGTVSQSGGVPTGAIIERGSNANGAYVRFADGTQICTANLTLTANFVQFAGVDWTFPAPFESVTSYTATGSISGADFGTVSVTADGISGLFVEARSATKVVFQLWRASGQPNWVVGETMPIRVVAVGRWF